MTKGRGVMAVGHKVVGDFPRQLGYEGRAGDFVSETEHVNSIATRLRQHNTDALQHADTVSGCPVSPVGGMEDRSRFLRESKPSIPRPPV